MPKVTHCRFLFYVVKEEVYVKESKEHLVNYKSILSAD